MSRPSKSKRFRLRAKRVLADRRRDELRRAAALARARARRPYEAEPDWARQPDPKPQPEVQPEAAAPVDDAPAKPTPETPRFDGLLWRVMRYRAGWRDEAEAALVELGVEIYRPMRTEAYTARGERQMTRQVPVMQRAFFVGVRDLDHLAEACVPWTIEPEHPLATFNGRVMEIAPASLRRFAEMLDEAEETPALPFEVGDQVVLIDGPFATFNGVVEEVREAEVDVALSIMGSSTAVTLGFAQVRKC